jgi:NADP-dependent 3-hydroxy acid dehydrogenase YdfG
MMPKDHVSVIDGAGGGIGGAVARASASKGRLTGHSLARVGVVAQDVIAVGGSAEPAEVDALDEQAVDRHLQSVIDMVGRVEGSFNAVGTPDTRMLGVPLVELDVDQFSLPIATSTTTVGDLTEVVQVTIKGRGKVQAARSEELS